MKDPAAPNHARHVDLNSRKRGAHSARTQLEAPVRGRHMRREWTAGIRALACASLLTSAASLSLTGTAGAQARNPEPAVPAAPMHIRILRVPDEGVRERRWDFLIAALDHTIPTYGPYVIDAYSAPMSTQREVEEVISGRLMNVIASDCGHPDLNEQTLPIAIPIDKGLLGYRGSLIRRDQQARFDAVNDIQGLRLLSVGQAQDWGDVPVYRYNRIPLVTTSHYDLLSPMLAHRRFDLFPRGVLEITPELISFQAQYPDMAIETHLLIRYSYAQFFYVNKSYPLIAQRIKDGLEEMRKDGSFEALFQKNFGRALADLHLERRVLINLKNPSLPNWVPVERKELWLNPVTVSKPG